VVDKGTAGCLVNLPLELVSALLKSLKSLKSVLDPTFAQKLVGEVRQVVIGRLTNMSDKDLKDVNCKTIMYTLHCLQNFLEIGMTTQLAAKEVETTQLNLSLRFLKCTFLEKRIKGLNDISAMITKVLISAKKAANQARKTGIPVVGNDWRGELDDANDDDGEYSTHVNNKKKQPIGSNYMTTNGMRDWMV